MFRDKRYFRALSFRSSQINSINDIRRLLPIKSISKGEKIGTDDSQLSIEHLNIYSTEIFSPAENIDEIKVPWRGIDQYQYDLYIFGFLAPDSFVGIIAFPLFKLAIWVCKEMQKAATGLGLEFYKVSLDRLINAILEKRHLGGFLKMNNSQMLVYGDPLAASIDIEGEDILHSKTFDMLNKKSTGISFNPITCKISYDNHEGQKFNMKIDRFGNYYFYVRSKGTNLPWVKDILNYFYSENLIEQAPAIPLRKIPKEEYDFEYI